MLECGRLRYFPILHDLVDSWWSKTSYQMCSENGLEVTSGLVEFYVQLISSAHISAPGILLCVKMGTTNRFIVDCSRYLSCFHIINQSGNALIQSSQSEEVLLSLHFLDLNIPNWPISIHYRATDWSILTDYTVG